MQISLLLLIFTVLPVLANDANAMSPLPKIFKFSKDDFLGKKEITVEGKKEWKMKDVAKEGKESKKKHEKKEEKKKIPEASSDLKEIEKEAEYASRITGVRKDYLMGMLVVETDLGRNTGQCTYKEVEDGAVAAYQSGNLSARAWQTFQERRDTIKGLAEDLGYDPEQLKVSCNPSQGVYAGTGGAMGVPQFMPDTWLEYHDRLSALTGKTHPDPWNVRDGVLAMALKLSDVPGVKDHNVWSEMAASKMYLSGSTSWRYDWYAQNAQYWARNYYELIRS